ncbi:hypothetical protein LASUN_13270 [Lentilactobacillus sunkii]|jgi:hypothetical protein|uniref:Uncharacterized protein n=1 Tax=Lentilactobacillus sunkii TaxID=481719 RepID=A0A1E7XCD6_9LACO|nr:hypothetical protein [Lentilactobacillus sunkii]OFA10777.1 hypothetical protein LASUN_13270 [Lentilactobacillus sunkii]
MKSKQEMIDGLVDEQAQLNVKFLKLAIDMNTIEFEDLESQQKVLLNAQKSTLETYSMILVARLNELTRED